jgi:hypothetical protein
VSRQRRITWQIPVNIEKFTGINLREDPGVISDHDLQLCTNFNLGRAGELTKRTGFEKVNTANLGIYQIKLIGFYQTATYSQILARIGTSLYYSTDGISWTAIGTFGQYTVEYGVQYNDKFYMVRKGTTMLEWNGTTIATVTGSPGGDFCIIHKERIFILDSSGTGQPNYRLYFSNVLAPTDWGTGSGSVDINAGDGDFLVGAAIVHDTLVVFKSRTTWGVYVQPNKIDWVVRNLNKAIGCSSKYSIRVIEDLIYFVSATNVFRTDGTSFKSISDNILPVLKDRLVNQTNVNIDDAFFWNDLYVVRLNPTTSTSRYFCYNIRIGGWTEWVMVGGIAPSSFLEIRASVVPSPGVYSGDINPVGNVYRYGNNVYADNAVTYLATMRTKDDDLGFRGNMKRGKWLLLDTRGAAAMTVTHYVNEVAGTPQVVNSVAGSQTQKAVGPGFFRTWAIDVSVSGTGPFQLFGITVYLHRKRTQIGASV